MKKKLIFYITISVLILFFVPQSFAKKRLSSGETVYVSVYSNAYSGPKQTKIKLSSTLNIRNTDQTHKLIITKADYYDSKGNLVESYVKTPISLNQMASTNFYIKEYDMRGGSGANFIIEWKSDIKINQPLIEALMIGQTISFICKGEVIQNH